MQEATQTALSAYTFGSNVFRGSELMLLNMPGFVVTTPLPLSPRIMLHTPFRVSE